MTPAPRAAAAWRTLACTVGLLVATGFSACTEKSQALDSARKADGKAWQSSTTPYTATGWQAGDPARWQAQLRQRAQNQNDYVRAPAAPPAASAP